MKAVLIFIASVWGMLGHAQNSLLINEIQASNQTTIISPDGRTPDWIEIHNRSNRTIDLQGMRLVVTGSQFEIEASLKIPPRGFWILWCDGRPELGPDHLPFKLSRKGGSLLLIAANGVSIIDVFTWPELFADESIGRYPDGKATWRFFSTPSPGASNDPMIGTTRRTSSVIADPLPGSQRKPIRLELKAEEGTIIFTTDGSLPTPTNGSPYSTPIPIDTTAAIRARAFSDEGIPGPEFAGTYIINSDRGALSLIIDRPDMWDTISGIGSEGPTANYTRLGREWERPARFQFNGRTRSIPVGLRISGSGSRSLPKRSFKVYARNRYNSPQDPFEFAGGAGFDEAMMRADAGPNAFLRNLLMETIVVRSRMNVAVQPSEPTPLYINGAYHGLYRWMPPKDAQWLRHISGAEKVDVLDGPASEVLSGSDDHFRSRLSLLLAGAPADSISKYFDLESLIDLACLDLFTGRADHDLNVRVYRPRKEGGKWKWVMFDMDLWAPVNDNSLERMITAPGVETPYISQLITDPELQQMLLARMATLNAVPLAPENTIAITDSLNTAHRAEIERDHELWKDQLIRPTPEEALTEMKTFLNGRGKMIMEQLARYTDRKLKQITIDVPDASIARMELNGIELRPGRQKITMFSGVEMELEILPRAGDRLVSWSGFAGSGTRIVFDPAQVRKLKPRLQ